jgi:hypothetical protein
VTKETESKNDDMDADVSKKKERNFNDALAQKNEPLGRDDARRVI